MQAMKSSSSTCAQRLNEVLQNFANRGINKATTDLGPQKLTEGLISLITPKRIEQA